MRQEGKFEGIAIVEEQVRSSEPRGGSRDEKEGAVW